MCSKLFLTFCSTSFSVPGFMWRSLIHLDLSFIQEIRKDWFAFFCMLTVFWTNTIWWRGCLFSLNAFIFFVKDQVTIGVWVHFWVFNSIPLIYLPVSVPTPCSFYHNWSVKQLEARDGDSPGSFLIVENKFCYPGFLLFQINLQIAIEYRIYILDCGL